MTHEFVGTRAEPTLHREIAFVVEGRPPTPNARRHWRAIARDNAEWKTRAQEIAWAARLQWAGRHGEPWYALERAVVDITFVVATKGRRDLDNLVSTLKPLLDGIVEAGVLADDSTDVIPSFSIHVEYRRSVTSVEFRISEPVE